MLLYSTLGTNDMPRATRFYDAIMGVLGQKRFDLQSEGWAAYGEDYDTGYGLFLCAPFDGAPATPGNGAMQAFKAESAAQVRDWYAAGLGAGGQDEGAPGLRDAYGPRFYVAYLRDPDGNKLACVFHRYDPAVAP
ncbi:VOC family protein [Pararhodobacter sp.]|uniref:VOC family protein n=1 Tax=Pararhodobacter sp. TaxID=2127056 RepID=UPI002FDF2FC0|nr:VOC family protein [Pseudomonadota bacterium]